MKKFFVIPLLVAAVFYSGNYFASVQVQAEIEPPQAQENTTEIYGKIKEANGNEIVIAVGSMAPEGRGGMDAGASANAAFDGQGLGDAQRGEAPARGRVEQEPDMQPDGRQPRDERPSGGAGNAGERQMARESQGGSGQGAGMPARGAMAANPSSLALTGEEKTFLIPVTAKITAGSGENERTIRFTQLAYKNTVRLTLSENDSVIAVNVLS